MDLSTKYTMKPSEKTKSDNEENTYYSQENTVKIEKNIISSTFYAIIGTQIKY